MGQSRSAPVKALPSSGRAVDFPLTRLPSPHPPGDSPALGCSSVPAESSTLQTKQASARWLCTPTGSCESADPEGSPRVPSHPGPGPATGALHPVGPGGGHFAWVLG